ncbi:hypothetical protein [Pseudoduganella buxea]|uniref:Uncharacterized protein n=1 Tax=Pseudoduganella buxea TaxID=1949069 RepID=A0A6I3T3Y6_9BURK|nr:hypothetical protein [Pseudoduganella buxea]MTV56370.1 hypothetical protein [Pseudoduganella buxea]GGC25420.1 hypothetical protein GCM10011572_53530 [Pseudoduganella buxea]
MGTIVHNAIVVTSNEGTRISAAAAMARSLGLQVLGPSEAAGHSYQSILVCPDGSKERHERSDLADTKRDTFRSWLASDGDELDWVEVRFGPDTEGAYVLHDAKGRFDNE